MEYPALFETDTIGVGGATEATGTVYLYCSPVCRSMSPFYYLDEFEAGDSPATVDGLVCSECGKRLE